MYFAFLDMIDSVNGFMLRGGPVLWIIAWLLLVKWSLVFERVWYLNTTHKANVKATLAAWNARSDTKSWSAHQIRTMMISKISLDVRNTLPIIEVLVTICPLLGLIGTVTGMIEVFFVMAVTGGGDAKSMAGGVSKATIPTMAGMVGAISGIFAANYLKAKVDRDIELLEDHLPLSN
ncbi:MAG: MotA/TolQ/ExbB proton channel family protein [OM182 bacterium]|jgi:biopolymer transport protein ExbB|nr:MotA/TolQ/ExbB proton channel family protein [Gammaproteobacteria bacterium]MDO7639565.1 MotA/TolQ/ExbB proton channel family protein [OM182 bacterium]MBT4781629.1 MotA/TolQ/ExbB proton channel family protein [Gammaproteobacteria bacterium]MBT5906868.1 MotA/TolQ/ExbB proton channel family protein [Gammaproteobacteria bacterium]MBT6316398.1 MotA/TolQ/ExbB proton channel family protein [Gammaproteobacteria bacterium]|tara:strand:+ start:214 stop:744 length:531 start_codon:yes stop_codon:yes gene_type:complete